MKPKALLDANEQWDPRVGSDANGGGRDDSRAVHSGAAGRDAAGSGAADSGVSAGGGTVGSCSDGSGADSGTVGSGAASSNARLNGAWAIAAGLTAAGLIVVWSAAAGLTAAGLMAVRRIRRRLEGSNGLQDGVITRDDGLRGQRRKASAMPRKRGPAAQKQRRLVKQRKQLARAQGRHCSSRRVGYALCARAVVVDDDGSERFLGSHESDDDGIPDRPSNRRTGQCVESPGARQGGASSSEGKELDDAECQECQAADVMQPPVQPIRARTATGYKGVNHDKARGVFRAVAIEKGRKRRLGDFPTAIEAAICYTQYVQGQRGQPTQATQAVGDDGLLWQLHTAPGTASGYAGVDAPPSTRKLDRPYRARHGGHSLGYHATATQAAVAYAQFICILDALGTEAIGEAALQAAQRLEYEENAEGGLGAGTSGVDAGVAGAAEVTLSWVSAELMGVNPDEVYGGQGGSKQGCGGRDCNDRGLGELGSNDRGCSGLSGSNLGCIGLSCGEQGCSGQGISCQCCNSASCDELGRGGAHSEILSLEELLCYSTQSASESDLLFSM